MTDTTRTTAKLATWGLVLTVGGLVVGIIAAHQSIFYTMLEAVGLPPIVWDEFGNATPVDNWAPLVAALAVVLLVAGVWCLVAVVWRIADRADGGPGVHRPGASLPAATLALAAPAAEVEAHRAADQNPSSD